MGWPGSSLGTMTKREKHREWVVALFHYWSGAYKVFQYFASGRFPMIVRRASRGKLLWFASRGVFIPQFKRIGVVLELL